MIMAKNRMSERGLCGYIERYKIIFMDISMPIMDGFEASRRIREFEKYYGVEKCLIIANSAHTTDAHKEESFKAEMDFYSKFSF